MAASFWETATSYENRSRAAIGIRKLRCGYLADGRLNRHRAGVIIDGLVDPDPGRHLVPAIEQPQKVPERPDGLEDGRRQHGATDGLHGIDGRNGAFRDVASRHVANLEPSARMGRNDCLEGGDFFLRLVNPARVQLDAGSRAHDLRILLRHADAAGNYSLVDGQTSRRIVLPSPPANRRTVNDFLGDPSDDEASGRRRALQPPAALVASVQHRSNGDRYGVCVNEGSYLGGSAVPLRWEIGSDHVRA